jgi:hypothetical protein
VSAAAPLPEDGPGWYLYGVVAAEEAPAARLENATAVDPQHPVALVVEGPLAGVASRVSLEEFDETALPQRLGDAAWVEQKVRAHEQVLEGVLEAVSVVPCRFCTVYRTEAELRRFLAERGDELTRALDRVAGRVELGVKAFIDRERFATGNDAVRELAERVSQAEGGRAYLEGRRLAQLVSQELARFGAEVAAALDERLRAAAEDGVRLGLQRPEVSGREEDMVLNSAYLVADGPRFGRELAALAADFRERGVELELTGPWPPYNFVPAELGKP